ncbi:MAG: efflux RND transporter periplasmic adaptor subunit [Candidatus Pacebacteria bacterium]|nr:efflux RND transporter periplasmic adaptor subunit [Candidatus Paceibacterota bacterium]
MKINKKTIVIAAVILVAGAVLYNIAKPKTATYKTAKVIRETITQEISETGTVKKGDAVSLNFKNAGTIAKVNAAEGDEVAAGRVLAELDTRQAEVQLAQAQASLVLSRTQLEKLMNGATAQEVAIARTAVQNAQTALESVNQTLRDAQTSAGQKLDTVYKTALDSLNSAYSKAYNAGNFVNLLQRTYFTPRDSDSITVWQTSEYISDSVANIKDRVDAAQSGRTADIDKALSVTLAELDSIRQGMEKIRTICENKTWRDTISTTDKSNLDTNRDYVIAAYASVNSDRADIDQQKNTNGSSINTAQAAVDAAKGALAAAQDQYSRVTAVARREDVDALNAQVAQAMAQVSLLEIQISDAQLKAPLAGTVAHVNVKAGETVSALASSPAAVIIPDDPFRVEVDIYEEDAAKEAVGNPVTIVPVPFPDKTYTGKVISIDPVGKTVNGVVYYTTKIAFDEMPEGLRPDMSADVTIIAAKKENVLVVPEAAVQKKAQEYYAQVLRGKKPVDVPVTTGIKAKGQVEIISGLNEGDEAIIP